MFVAVSLFVPVSSRSRQGGGCDEKRDGGRSKTRRDETRRYLPGSVARQAFVSGSMSQQQLYSYLWAVSALSLNERLTSRPRLGEQQQYHTKLRPSHPVTPHERIPHMAKQPTWRTKIVRLACRLQLNILRDSPDHTACLLGVHCTTTRDRIRDVLENQTEPFSNHLHRLQ